MKQEKLIANKALENLRMRLLDLTARNRLINFHHTKNACLRIIDELPNQLVEKLLTDTVMSFKAIPEPTEKELIEAGYIKFDDNKQELIRLRKDPNAEEWAKKLGFVTDYEVPQSSADDKSGKHSDNSIQTLLYPYEMEARVQNLLQSAESAIQEMGTNILYIAFGFLEWYESTGSDNAHIAPLFLVPVRIQKGRLNPQTRTYEYTLNYSGEDIIPNLSLREKLRIDFAMALPDLNENTIPEDYFNEIHTLIKDNQTRWQVRRYISLALLNFNKLLMYLDLDPSRWPANAGIVDHPVVSHILSGYGHEEDAKNKSSGYIGFGEEYLIDDIENVHNNYPLIDDADSSQHSALIDAINGKNLVIEGPPGTGKSQTITNLIAAALAKGKKVLFVAEKLAALEVVRRRLDKAGIGEFCLELHSHKSQKRKLIDEIDERIKKHGYYQKPKDMEADIGRYEELKTILKNHAEKINLSWKNTGKTIHEIFMTATRYRNSTGVNPEDFHPEGYDGRNYDTAAHRRNTDHISTYRKVYQAVERQLNENASLHEHPWYGIHNSNLQIFDLNRVKESLGKWQESLKYLFIQLETIAYTIGCKVSDIGETLPEVQTFLNEMTSIPELKGDEILDRLPVLNNEELEKSKYYLKLFLDIQGLYSSLAKMVGPEIIKNLSIADQLHPCNNELKQLVGLDIKLSDLSGAINRLIKIENQLELLNEPLHGLSSALGKPADQYLTLSESGLTEFKMIIELIADFNPSYWRYRNKIFDNEELDDLLPRLRVEIEELRTLQNSFHDVFSLENIPEKNEIRLIAATLASGGGAFRWFKKNWRAARKQLLIYAANTKVKYHSMLALLDDFSTFVEKKQKLDTDTRYKEILGDYLEGINTDLDKLESLRSSYKRVRKQYGVGFGQKVLLGNALIELPPNIFNAVRSLAERGVQTEIDKLLNDFCKLKDIFEPVRELGNKNTLLSGETGIISYIIGAVNKAMKVFGSLINNDSLSIADLADRAEQIGLLKQYVEKWNNADFDNKLFQGRLCLKTGVDINNSDGLSSLYNTLKIAAFINTQLCNKFLIAYIYN